MAVITEITKRPHRGCRQGVCCCISLRLAIIVLCCISGYAYCEDSCGALGPEVTQRIEAYINQLYEITSPSGFDRHHVRIVSSEIVNSLCYRQLSVETGTSGKPIIFYLSPDKRFLSISLSDTAQSPLKARVAREATVESQLTHDKSPSIGDGAAPLKLVIFEDYECPHCKKLEEWLRDIPSDLIPKVQIIYKNFPLSIHPQATEAGAISVCAGLQNNNAFSQVSQFLFDEQEQFGSEALLDAVKHHFETTQTVDLKLLISCFNSREYLPILTRDRQLGENLKIVGTPTVFLNGRQLTHLSASSDLIKELLARLELEQPSGSLSNAGNLQSIRSEVK